MAEEKKMPNAKEDALMIQLMIVRNALVEYGEAVRERLRPVKGGWRDLRLMISLVTKTQNRLVDTMPERRWDYYYNLSQRGRIRVELPGPAKIGRYIMIHEKNLSVLAEAAMCGECAMCLRTGREVRGCLIRDALMEVAPPEEVRDLRGLSLGCEYRDAAGQLVRQEEITL